MDEVLVAGQERRSPDGTVWAVVRQYVARDGTSCVQLRSHGRPTLTMLARDALAWPVVVPELSEEAPRG